MKSSATILLLLSIVAAGQCFFSSPQPGNTECVDEYTQCPKLAKDGKCFIFQRNCPLSCKRCHPPSTRSPVSGYNSLAPNTLPINGCTDSTHHCPEMVQRDSCTHPSVRVLCQRSCNSCKQRSTTPTW